MRVLHAPQNLAGVAWNLACAQRGIGLESDCVAFPHPFGYPQHREYHPPDPEMHFKMPPRRREIPRDLLFAASTARKYDVVHLHGTSLVARRLDLPLHRLAGKRVVMHYHGTDIRGRAPRSLDRFAHHMLVSTPDLLQFAPGSTWLPNPVPDHGVRRSTGDTDRVTVGHMPSSRTRKGTANLRSAVSSLQKAHPEVCLRIVEDVSHSDALRALGSFDMLVDCVEPAGGEGSERRGWYGVVANEAQHAGIPVLTTIRDDLAHHLPVASGIVPVDASSLLDVLMQLVEDPGRRRRLGEEGKRFVSSLHDPDRVARITREIYLT